MKYLISYDLTKPGQNYPRLYTELDRAGARRVLLSAWAFSTTSNATQIVNWLRQYVDATDRIVVTELNNWASVGSMTDINQI